LATDYQPLDVGQHFVGAGIEQALSSWVSLNQGQYYFTHFLARDDDDAEFGVEHMPVASGAGCIDIGA